MPILNLSVSLENNLTLGELTDLLLGSNTSPVPVKIILGNQPAPPPAQFFLLEDMSNLLIENGSRLGLE